MQKKSQNISTQILLLPKRIIRSSCLSGNTDRQKRRKQRKKSEGTYNERRGIKPMENVRSEDRTYLQEFPQIMPDQLHITVPVLKITET